MSNRVSKPITPLAAYLASLALLLGPVASFGTCCCSRAAATAAQQAAAETELSSCCSSAARPTSKPVAAKSCCSGSSEAKCSEPVAPAKGPCQCKETCCDALVPENTAVLGSAAEQRDLPSDEAPLLGILDLVDWRLESVVIVPHREPLTLSAQAHCALHCRWLN